MNQSDALARGGILRCVCVCVCARAHVCACACYRARVCLCAHSCDKHVCGDTCIHTRIMRGYVHACAHDAALECIYKHTYTHAYTYLICTRQLATPHEKVSIGAVSCMPCTCARMHARMYACCTCVYACMHVYDGMPACIYVCVCTFCIMHVCANVRCCTTENKHAYITSMHTQQVCIHNKYAYTTSMHT
jgi:hypothetical protein